ncbi:MAG: response regulator [Candidatus Desulfatibia sp.]|uniref:response regulator n=1 Tax=Candidatus Desulfatibia sp. TaxID=3101189 RepID=UPI002F2F9123
MSKAQILIVEDDAIVSLDIESRLKELGYSVPEVVITGERAIQKVEEHNPDLVLMDIVLKGEMDGIEAAGISWHF